MILPFAVVAYLPSRDGKERELAQNQIVAIVDDDELVRSSMASLLRSLGIPARTFGSADEYLNADDTHEVACLVTDIQMPGTSGLQLQQILAARAVAPPVIMMTAFPSERIRTQAFEAGALCFIEKPIDEKHLLACLGEVFDGLDD
jgi:FixJ family two-component response regulator